MTEKEIALEYLKGLQRHFLMKRYGLSFEKIVEGIKKLPSLYDFVEMMVESKSNLSEDDKYELEAKLKGQIIDTKFLNTEYEHPAEWFILFSLFENVKKILPSKSDLPYIGVISSGEINAMAYAVRDTSIKFILIEGELFTCANLLSKIFAQSTPLVNDTSFSFSVDKSFLEKHLQNDLLTQRFNDFFYNTVNDKPSGSNAYFMGNDHLEHLSSVLLDSLEHFVIGHEYGHIHFNHLDSALLNKAPLNFDDDELMEIQTNWDQEFQADNFGAQIIIAMDKSGAKFPYSILGPDLLFNFYHFKNEFSANEIIQESNSHPAPLERKKHVRSFMLSIYSKKDQEILKLAYKMVDDIFDYHILNYKKYITTKQQ